MSGCPSLPSPASIKFKVGRKRVLGVLHLMLTTPPWADTPLSIRFDCPDVLRLYQSCGFTLPPSLGAPLLSSSRPCVTLCPCTPLSGVGVGSVAGWRPCSEGPSSDEAGEGSSEAEEGEGEDACVSGAEGKEEKEEEEEEEEKAEAEKAEAAPLDAADINAQYLALVLSAQAAKPPPAPRTVIVISDSDEDV